MKQAHLLLAKRWVLRQADPDLYYKLKDSQRDYHSFFRDKLGYRLIVNPLLIKVEKIPGEHESWMGIAEFSSEMEYAMLCVVLMFLEDLEPEEQFVLAQIIDYVHRHYPKAGVIDWTLYAHRKAMMRVLRFCVDEWLFKITDGNDSGFMRSQDSVEVLYENTGASKYFMRRFNFEIGQLKTADDFKDIEWSSDDKDRGIIRRHRVYRRLTLSPIVYWFDKDDQDYLYIKNQRGVLQHDFEQFLDADLQIHKNGAQIIFEDDYNNSFNIPNRRNITDIVLQFAKLLTNQIKAGTIACDQRDIAALSIVQWETQLRQFQSAYQRGWSKLYRTMSFKALAKEIEAEMIKYGMIMRHNNGREIMILSLVGKFHGDYPDDYKQKISEVLDDAGNADDAVEN